MPAGRHLCQNLFLLLSVFAESFVFVATEIRTRIEVRDIRTWQLLEQGNAEAGESDNQPVRDGHSDVRHKARLLDKKHTESSANPVAHNAGDQASARFDCKLFGRDTRNE